MTRGYESGIFWTTALTRFGLFLAISLTGEGLSSISRDSEQFHQSAIEISESYLAGVVHWSRWIDDAWPEFVGLCYLVFGQSLIPVMTFNSILIGFASVFLYRIALAATGDTRVAAATGFSFALFPSAIWFHSVPLKECAAGFALLALIGGILEIKLYKRKQGWGWILLALAIMAGLRVYLVPVLSVCVVTCLLPIKMPRSVLGMMLPVLCLTAFAIAFFYSISVLGIDFSEHEALKYFDLEKLNSTRASLSRGSGRMFSRSGQDAAWGQDPLTDITLGAKALWFTVAGVDPTNLRSARQFLAMPEAIAIIYSLPCLIAGITNLWRNNIRAALPILIVTLAIVIVYGAGTTNMGAMYRWRIQALPGVFLLIYYGAACRKKSLFYAIVCLFRHGQTLQHSTRPQSLGT